MQGEGRSLPVSKENSAAYPMSEDIQNFLVVQCHVTEIYFNFILILPKSFQTSRLKGYPEF